MKQFSVVLSTNDSLRNTQLTVLLNSAITAGIKNNTDSSSSPPVLNFDGGVVNGSYSDPIFQTIGVDDALGQIGNYVPEKDNWEVAQKLVDLGWMKSVNTPTSKSAKFRPVGKVLPVTGIGSENDKGVLQYTDARGKANSMYLDKIDQVTAPSSREIDDAQSIVIAGSKVAYSYNKVSVGCQSFTNSEWKTVVRILARAGISSVKYGSSDISIDVLQRVASKL